VYWLVLVVSGVLEAVRAAALERTQGFSRLGPTVVFVVAIIGSMLGLAFALRGLTLGTAYAVWVGIGAVLAVDYAMWTGQEPVTVVRLLLLLGIVGCVVGLRLTQ
jgi:quaternary ammonium compound-resistance protein SugE